MTHTYDLDLPVQSQGDDFLWCLTYIRDEHPHLPPHRAAAEAFRLLEGLYRESARKCRRIASICAEHPGVRVTGQGNLIQLTSDKPELARFTHNAHEGAPPCEEQTLLWYRFPTEEETGKPLGNP